MKKALILKVSILCFLYLPSAFGQNLESKNIPISQMPLLVLAYQEVFNIGNQLSDKLWPEKIPYEKVPVLAYDPAKKEEYLINFPKAFPKNYELTPFQVNGKSVYKKIGALSFPYPGGQACKVIDGFPVVSMGYGCDTPLEQIVQTFLHEGFHFYQFHSLYLAGLEKEMDFPYESPRDEEFDADLVVEGKLLFELTNGTETKEINADLTKKFVAVEVMRKKKLSTEFKRRENFSFLTEGTATYVELKLTFRVNHNDLF